MRYGLGLLLAALSAGVTRAADEPKQGTGKKPPEHTPAAKPEEPGVQSLFDGEKLGDWKVVDFHKHGAVKAAGKAIVMEPGSPMTGVVWKGAELAKLNYEIRWEARRTRGQDFFAALTFPVKDQPCTFVAAGWGGNITGLSSINGADASENETLKYVKFENDRWYKFKLRVDAERIRAWVDEESVVDFPHADVKLSVRIEVEQSRPFGFAAYKSQSEIRRIEFVRLESSGGKPATSK